ncbi:RHS repeat-associated core domain-containing protein [Vandammella animalimorsus]
MLSPGAAPTAIHSQTQYDSKGQLTSQTDPEGQRSSSSYHYDAAGQLTEETNPLGQITRHQYNPRGDKTQTTHPSGLTDTWAYDAEGRETRACQAGLCTQTQYDSLGRAIQTTDPAGHTSATAYDAAGQITSATDPLGHQTTYQYDLAGRQTQSTDPPPQQHQYRYDAAGNLTEETNPLGQITRHSYNAAHQKTATTGPSGAATHYQYSPTGQRTSQTSPEGRQTQYSYDSLGRLSQVTDAQGNATGYQYNSQGQLLAQTDAEGKTTQYGYDRAGRRVQRTLADGASETLHYNALGQLTQKTHFDGSQTTWEYGAAATPTRPNPAWGQITREHRADGSSQSRSYDGHGRHIQTSDSRDGTETRDLDLLGRVTQQSTTHSAAQLSGSSAYQSRQNYQWDARGLRTQLHAPASGNSPEHRISASWDAAGQLQSLQASSDAAANQFTHDGAGRLTQITRSDGSSTSYQYTPDGHISQIRHQGSQGQTLAQFDYQHNRDGQRTQAVEVIHAAGSTAPTTQRTINWTYDSAGKLTQEQITQTQPTAQTLSIAYQYDKVGNRTARTVSGAIQQTTTYQYDQNDRLTQSSDSIEGTTSYRYDRKGNLVEKANGNNKTAYSWNSDNRLIKVEQTAAGSTTKTTTYGYDPQGRRIKKLVQQGQNKTETHYSIDAERPYHEVLVEWTKQDNGPWTYATYLHTPGGVGELISQSDGTTTKQIYADAQGTTRLIADGATGTSQSYSFDAFGNWLEGDSLDNAPTHLYTGERYDADTGLIYLRARDYDPSTGRFISMDEHPGDQRIPLTLNKYLYANADPVNHVDPSGNFGIAVGVSGVQLAAISTITLAAGWGIYSSMAVDSRGNRRFGVWDAVALSAFRSSSEINVESRTIADEIREEERRRNHGHHTIPVYLCGSMNQRPLANISPSQHGLIHAEIAAIYLALGEAEKYAYRALGRHRSSEVLRIAQTESGRTAIVNALQMLYMGGWWDVGSPVSIGSAFSAVKGAYVSGAETSLPWCTRNGGPR